jgi:D-tyrosyl-tRNA(Tyr) deacylase
MRFLIQVVNRASVEVKEQNHTAAIGQWLLIYIWIHKSDIEDYRTKITHFVSKIRSLQVFHLDGKLQGTLDAVGWEILLVSNFTLYWENKKWNRFDFADSAWFDDAQKVYDDLIVALKNEWIQVKAGIFGAYMEVESVNGGPINFLRDI